MTAGGSLHLCVRSGNQGRKKKKRKFEIIKMYFQGAEISILQKFNEGL